MNEWSIGGGDGGGGRDTDVLLVLELAVRVYSSQRRKTMYNALSQISHISGDFELPVVKTA